jgi:hypothetical protein
MKVREVVRIESHLVGMICWCDVAGIAGCGGVEENVGLEKKSD